MEEAKNPVRVTIFGEEYSIRSDKGEEYTVACAKHVDDLIQEAHVRAKVPEPHKAAILAAMQITDQMFRATAASKTQSRVLADRLAGLRARVDAALGRSGEEAVEQGSLTPDN